ncbi:hypothetical protein SLEP1_g32070 [Rubroshorea leprosula]|uniref:Uncharacterized protein n=1 Tax=Rubroshorea leprosula TaxID=152421 RepID=A0AAV5KC55_9ROSI|nr:hypothetical protein SLEP1_g32070 [Rubroshorea leprosula]
MATKEMEGIIVDTSFVWENVPHLGAMVLYSESKIPSHLGMEMLEETSMVIKWKRKLQDW